MDATQEPVKSDIVFCLGGGTIDRVKKSIALLKEGYSEKFLLLGESWYNQPYIKKNYPELPVTIDESPKNTEEEVLFIKRYMKAHGHKSALIVTDPPHTRRVKVLASHLLEDDNITFRMIGSDVAWWDARNYYRNEKAFHFALNELFKIPYTYVYYGLLEKIGFKWSESEYWTLKKKFGEFVNEELLHSAD